MLLLKSGFSHRLRRASAAEILYRIRKMLTARRLKSALSRGASPFAIPAVDSAHLAALEMPRLSVWLDRSLIQRLIDGETFRLNADAAAIAAFEEKHRNRFSDTVKQVPGDPDLRAVWEPARLQYAAMLLLHPAAGAAGREAGKGAVLNWIAAHPFLRGPHYMSAMECGLRVSVFFYCLKAAPDLSEEECGVLLRALFEHAWWIERNLSLYASLGNHSVCECVRLVFAGAVFQSNADGRQWLETGCRLLDQELEHQILPDGGPVEQSLSYHRFVLDLYWLISDFLHNNRLRDTSKWIARLKQGEVFFSSLSERVRLNPRHRRQRRWACDRAKYFSIEGPG